MKLNTDTMAMRDKSVLICYHADCIDGFTAAWVTYNACKKMGADHIKLMPVKYGPDNEAMSISESEMLHYLCEEYIHEVFIVDFSISILAIKQFQSSHPNKSMTILDHHKTAFERYFPEEVIGKLTQISETRKNVHILLDNDESGASMCWKYFQQDAMPYLIHYVKDYDLWRFELGDETKYMNKILKERKQTIRNWDSLAADLEIREDRENILLAGADLYNSHMRVVERIAAEAIPITIAGYKGLVVQCSYAYVSDVGHMLADQCGTFGAMYQIDHDTLSIKWSLRGVDDMDVSHIAKQFGGGGHKGAAGFEVAMIPAITPMIPDVPEDNRYAS